MTAGHLSPEPISTTLSDATTVSPLPVNSQVTPVSSRQILYVVVAVAVVVVLLSALGVFGGGEVAVPTGTPGTAG